jgi:hypothetical protein
MESREAAEAIHRTFPDLEEATVRPLEHGWSHWTYAHGDRIFRFPRTPNDARLLEGDMSTLKIDDFWYMAPLDAAMN